MDDLILKPVEEGDYALFSHWLDGDTDGMKFLPSYADPKEWKYRSKGNF